MSDQYYPPVRRSRVEQHSKRRKTNFILNILMFIVFIGIVVVGWNILFGADSSATDTTANNAQEEQKGDDESSKGIGTEDEKDGSEEEENEGTETEGTAGDEEGSENENEGNSSNSGDNHTGNNTEDEGTITELESDDPNVLKVVIDPSWKPVGTTQTGEHITQYDDTSVDWQEMLKAISYATGVSVDNMTVNWIGVGEIPNKNVIGTITDRNTNQYYRVYLEWVDGQGWKPTKMEYLKELDLER